MTLTNRLNLFFLTALALVLAGFSCALYGLARHHLHRQAEDRLESALNTLAAVAEITPQGIEWDSSDRRVAFLSGGDAPLWHVRDAAGRTIGRSAAPESADFLIEAAEHLQIDSTSAKRLSWQGSRWLFRQEWLRSENYDSSAQPEPGKPEKKYPAVAIIVGAPLEPVKSALRELAGALAGLSLAIWLVGLLAGRFVCRRALRPVTRMAESARAMDASGLDRRLPATIAGDELEDLARSFNGLLDRLQESFERQRRFTGDASHQLRTPLTAVLGQVEVALRRERPSEEYRHVLGSVQVQTERLRHIVEALLFLARADAEARLPDRVRLDLRDWLGEQMRGWAGHPRAGDIHTEVATIEPAAASVHPVLLGELLNVLIDNACKYSPPGTPVTVRLAQAGGQIELSVSDAGDGIAAEDVARLFTPFFRAPAVRLRGVDGLGLGLAVAQRIADAHGGSLTVESRPGAGSRFTLHLPELA